MDSDKSSGRSICDHPYEIIKELGLANNDLVELEGLRKTGAIVFPCVTDKGLRNIRLDKLLQVGFCTSARV